MAAGFVIVASLAALILAIAGYRDAARYAERRKRDRDRDAPD